MANCCSSKSSNRETRSSEETAVPSNEDIRTKIVHGDDAVQGEFPYQVCKQVEKSFYHSSNDIIVVNLSNSIIKYPVFPRR